MTEAAAAAAMAGGSLDDDDDDEDASESPASIAPLRDAPRTHDITPEPASETEARVVEQVDTIAPESRERDPLPAAALGGSSYTPPVFESPGPDLGTVAIPRAALDAFQPLEPAPPAAREPAPPAEPEQRIAASQSDVQGSAPTPMETPRYVPAPIESDADAPAMPPTTPAPAESQQALFATTVDTDADAPADAPADATGTDGNRAP